MITEKAKNETLMKCQPKNLFYFTVPRYVYSYPLPHRVAALDDDGFLGPAFRGDVFMSLFSYDTGYFEKAIVILHPQFGVCSVCSYKKLDELSWASML